MPPLWKKLFKKSPQRKPAGGQKNGTIPQDGHSRVFSSADLKQIPVSSGLNRNLDLLQSILGRNTDVVFRRFRLGLADQTEAAVIYVDGMVEKDLVNSDIMKPLMLESRMAGFSPARENLPGFVKNHALTVSGVKDARSMEDLVAGVLYGHVALIIDGQDTALVMDIKGWKVRGISEPLSEVLVRGPREGFTENLRDNTTLIRRRLRSPNLVIENMHVGRITRTEVAIAYIKGITDPDLVREVKARLGRIDIDGVLESSYLEELIQDHPYSPFPQVLNSERPDRVTSGLLNGRVAILTDGTPIALMVPGEFITFLHTSEDYYQNYMVSTAVRWVRYVAFAISLLLPSLYIAITTFHQEMIPTRLLITLAAAREGVPFPALLEALLMEFTFEALREAGIRLPRAVGQAVSIVGALVIGQAAVQAGIVSPLMVIVVAVTGIASFVNPSYNIAFALRMLRFPIMLLAATLGLFGIMTGILAILIHLSGLRSFGVPYLSSLAPFHAGDLKDVAVRAPWWAMDKRPAETGKLNPRRQARGLKPSPPDPGGQGGGQG